MSKSDFPDQINYQGVVQKLRFIDSLCSGLEYGGYAPVYLDDADISDCVRLTIDQARQYIISAPMSL